MSCKNDYVEINFLKLNLKMCVFSCGYRKIKFPLIQIDVSDYFEAGSYYYSINDFVYFLSLL